MTNFIVSHCSKFCGDWTRIKSLLKKKKNIGMVSQKLYRNTLLSKFSSYSILIAQNASYKRTLKIDPATPNDMNSLPLIQITIWYFLRLKTFQFFMETSVFRFKCRRLNCNQEQIFFWSACKRACALSFFHVVFSKM